MSGPILTDGEGRPIPTPEPPPRDAGIEARIAYIRARAAYTDAVTDTANAAFAATFRKALR